MDDNLYSQHWYRVAELKPALQRHVEIHRHDYHGLIWYVIEDSSNNRHHRFNPAAYQFIGLMDGKRTVAEIATVLNQQLGDFAPSQDEIIQLINQLHAADLIKTDVLLNIDALFERQSRLQKAKLNQQLANPLSQKIPLWDPENFLTEHLPKVRWLFTLWMALVWCMVILFAALQLGSNWQKVAKFFDISALSPYNLVLAFLIYPLIKIVHELGHAFATRIKGGEVHEMGVNFMLFIPVPYVNVSSSTHFRSIYDRILVSAAGILVETFLAALGLLLFLAAESGILQAIGFNLFFIGGVSSLFFNGNPLLKYDGYYVLADVIGVPNLFQRSGQYWRYLAQRYLLGLKKAVNPALTAEEACWFIVYWLCSLIYRLGILWFICIYVTDKFFSIGVLLAVWLVFVQIILPIYKAIGFVIKSPSLGIHRNRAAVTTCLLALTVIAITAFVPVSSYTLADGVVWLPDEALIKAEHDGFISELTASNHQFVKRGDVVIRLSDDTLETQARMVRSKLVEIQGQYRAEREKNLVKADILKDEYRSTQAELDNLDSKINNLSIKAAKNGQLLLSEAEDLPGRFVRHGEIIGYVVDDQPPGIRMAVTQDNIGQLREHISAIDVRLSNQPEKTYPASLVRLTPEATNKLFSPALATTGGGKIQLEPGKEKDLLTLQKIFWVDLKFNPYEQNIPLGMRVFVRINHGGEVITKQLYRRIRQAFLRHFNV